MSTGNTFTDLGQLAGQLAEAGRIVEDKNELVGWTQMQLVGLFF